MAARNNPAPTNIECPWCDDDVSVSAETHSEINAFGLAVGVERASCPNCGNQVWNEVSGLVSTGKNAEK